jgi:polygalacturonase
MKNRREFLKLGLAASLAAVTPEAFGSSRILPSAEDRASGKPWEELPRILSRIKPPTFPARDFEITKFGGIGDNKFDNTDAFKAAIAACEKAGGGRVVVPAGEFVTGAIELKSNINLHVTEKATVRFTHDTKQYPLVFTRWEGMECMNYSPFLYAFEQENIGITGSGTIDGNASQEYWWPWKGNKQGGWKSGPTQAEDREKLYAMVARGVPPRERIFGAGYYLRPQFIQPYRSKNIVIEGVRLLNSPLWQVTPCLCTNVTVRNLYISSFGPNTDGCDPESCTDVLIKDCFFNTGDDCIAIKSGRNDDGRRVNVPAQNIVIQGCHMKDGHGGVTVGSEISGGVRNVFAEDCQMDSPHLDMALRIKNNAARGGVIENVHARNITVGQVAQAAISIDFYYEEGEKGGHTPVVRNVSVDNMKTQKSKYAVYLRGFKDDPIDGISLVNCEFNGVAQGNVLENVANLYVRDVRINGAKVQRLA